MQKPICIDRDKEDFFRVDCLCPECGTFLAGYTYGRAWTDNGLPQHRRHHCANCGAVIDWSEVPLPPSEEVEV